MIKLFWNTHNQKDNPSDKEDRDLLWGLYHKDFSDKWIYEILNKIKFNCLVFAKSTDSAEFSRPVTAS